MRSQLPPATMENDGQVARLYRLFPVGTEGPKTRNGEPPSGAQIAIARNLPPGGPYEHTADTAFLSRWTTA